MKQDGHNGKTESQAAATLCKKKVRCVSPIDHIPSQLSSPGSKPSPGLIPLHLATSPKCSGKRRYSLGEMGRKATAFQTSPLHLCPM